MAVNPTLDKPVLQYYPGKLSSHTLLMLAREWGCPSEMTGCMISHGYEKQRRSLGTGKELTSILYLKTLNEF